jgi:hypothetical protein
MSDRRRNGLHVAAPRLFVRSVDADLRREGLDLSPVELGLGSVGEKP